jgi:long-chain fatty acid adenylase/transferase FadD26
MSMRPSSITALLEERASQRPDDVAFTYVDYEVDPAGYPESLTWSQLYRAAQVVAEELALCGSSGDRAAILAPQGLEYVVAFLGALQAGFIAVPLPVPELGRLDERVASALEDSQPVVLLTTSAVPCEVSRYARAHGGHSAPRIVEIDSLDLDSPAQFGSGQLAPGRPAYLQYTSGSTRTPAGVVISHRNVIANLEQMMADYLEHLGRVPPPEMTLVSWLPFYHDMGLVLFILWPIMLGRPAVFMSPMGFLQRPARWMQWLARAGKAFSAAPNFAFELAVRRTSDEDMAGLDLGNVVGIINGSERVHAPTLRRFTERFARFNFPEAAILPSYGLAEATVYVATPEPGRPSTVVRFEYQKLSAGHAKRCENQVVGGTELVSYGGPRASTIRIVDPDTCRECPAGTVGELWVHGENVALGYWRNPELTERTFNARLVGLSPGTAVGPWLRTGDLAVMFDGELFIVGRIKDLLIVDGRNHYPDDIEATIQEVTGGRVAAVSITDGRSERLVTIIEVKDRSDSGEDRIHALRNVKRKVASAVNQSHSLRVSDVVLVQAGSIPKTTSGKIRRSACAQRYKQDEFTRLDVSV